MAPDRRTGPNVKGNSDSRTAAPAPGEQEYFARIEGRFQQLRGSPILLSPKDWLRVSFWWKGGIPARVVLRGIEIAFERKRDAEPGGVVRSLGYCEPIIREEWERWRQESVTHRSAQHADNQEGEDQTVWIRKHLESTGTALETAFERSNSAALQDALRDCLRFLKEEISKLSASHADSLEEMEKRLLVLEKDLGRIAMQVLDAAEMERIGTEVDRELAPYKDLMTGETFQETRELLTEDRIRRVFSLPRISFFSLV